MFARYSVVVEGGSVGPAGSGGGGDVLRHQHEPGDKAAGATGRALGAVGGSKVGCRENRGTAAIGGVLSIKVLEGFSEEFFVHDHDMGGEIGQISPKR